MRFYKPNKYAWGLLFSCLLFICSAQAVKAASAKFTPSLLVGYQWDDNVGAVDPDQVDPITMQWVNYLVGLEGSVYDKNTSLTLGGWLGYSHYVNSNEDLKDLIDIPLSDFSYFNVNLKGEFQHVTPSAAFNVSDEVKRSRRFSDIFTYTNSDFSDFYLYTDNLASVQVRFRTRSPLNFLFKYTYESTVFDEPEGDVVSRPGSSYAQTGYAKTNYRLSSKVDVSLELQGGQRVYEDTIIIDGSGDESRVKVSDYNFYQGFLELGYKFNARSSVSAAAGAHHRHFFNEGDRELKDYTIPIGRITYNLAGKNKNSLAVGAETGSNTYGLDNYFDYWQASAELTYYISKPIFLSTNFVYKQDYYNRDRLNLEDVWAHNRLDNIYIADAAVNLDLLRRRETPYLSLSVRYEHLVRDSNIDHASDYESGYTGGSTSYDTQVNQISVQLKFNPTILIGI